jgi:leader peptidase (prepilin peptidase)/N-methyltransferase
MGYDGRMPTLDGVFGGLIVAFGACLGSFAGVCIERLPVNLSICTPRSRCAGCGQGVAWYDNLPILSFLLLRGRCRRCSAAIPVRLWLLEILMAALTGALVGRFGLGVDLLVWLPTVWLLVVVAYLDIDHFWVPDVLTYPGIALALAAAFLPGRLGLRAALLGLLPAAMLWAVAWAFSRVTKKDALGLGDIKLLAFIGLCFGAPGALTTLLLASLQGAVLGSVVLLLGGHAARDLGEADPENAESEASWQPPAGALPFGPFLSLGALQVLLLPEHVAAGQRWILQFMMHMANL